jgi:hypothetical protein
VVIRMEEPWQASPMQIAATGPAMALFDRSDHQLPCVSANAARFSVALFQIRQAPDFQPDCVLAEQAIKVSGPSF